MSCDRCLTGCWAHVQWHCRHAGLIRVYRADQAWGDPYCYAIPFHVRSRRMFWKWRTEKRGMLELEGMTQVMSLCQARAIMRAVKNEGWGIVSDRHSGARRGPQEVGRRHWR